MNADSADEAVENLPPLRSIIADHQLSARKHLGQNFLLDLNLTRRIARAAGPLEQGTIVEIGPGPGGLTRGLLLEGAQRLVAVEKDARAVAALETLTVAAGSRLTVHLADASRINLADLEVRATEIFTTSSNDDLILNAQGTGSVKIKDTLELTKTPGDDDILLDPNAPLDGIKLYSKTQSSGKTGLYFVNDSNYQDEIISKNRALLYSIIF